MKFEKSRENPNKATEIKILPDTWEEVYQILSQQEHDELLKEINENIIGVKTECIISPEAQIWNREKLEILIIWKEWINWEEFLKKGYKAWMSFEIFKKILEFTKQYLKDNLNQKISLNLHPKDFLNTRLEEQLKKLFLAWLNPENLTLELLEEEIDSNDMKSLFIKLKELKEKYWLSISMDDFDGTTEMLKRYESLMNSIDTVKIDKNYFWAACGDSKKNENTKISELSYFIEQLHSDWKKVVIEWIETNQHIKFATTIWADLLQGYYFNRDN